VGVKHLCKLEYTLDVTFTVTPLGIGGGPPFEVPIMSAPVQTLNESTYEHPLVAVCCTDVTEHPDWEFEDSCRYEHHRWCMSDFLDHVCLAPGNWLEALASEYTGQGQEAIEAAAKWLRENRQACYNHFWTGPDDLLNADYCDAQFDGNFVHDPWEPGESFVFAVFGVPLFKVSDIIVEPRSNFGLYVPAPPPNPAEACEEPISNDGEAPPLSSPGSTGSFHSPVTPVAVDVDGPELNQEPVTGVGEFGTGSVLQWYTNSSGELEIEYWRMTEHATTTVGTSSMAVAVSGFRLATVRHLRAGIIDGGWELDAGSVVFDLSANVDGVSESVRALNSSPIELYTVAGGTDDCPTLVSSCLVSKPFTLSYVDVFDQTWTANVLTATWRP
jgi:hypothetical protein